MKVAQIILSSGTGGAEKSFVDLCNALASSVEVVAITLPGTDYAAQLNEKVKLYPLRSGSGRLNPALHFEIARLLQREQPDIVHTHTAKATEVIHRLKPFLPGHHVATKRNDRRGRIFNRVDNVIAISDRVAQSIRGNGAAIIYNGIDALELESRSSKNPRFTLCAIGRLERVKGFDRLIDAVSGLDFEFQLQIYGEGPERTRLAALIDRLNLRNQVKLMGYVERIPQVLQAADLVVVSSLSEGFNRVLIEAIHYAPMLISTPVGVAEHLLGDEFIMKPEEMRETIQRIHDNYDQYLPLFNRLKREKGDLFSNRTMVEAHLKYYQALL